MQAGFPSPEPTGVPQAYDRLVTFTQYDGKSAAQFDHLLSEMPQLYADNSKRYLLAGEAAMLRVLGRPIWPERSMGGVAFVYFAGPQTNYLECAMNLYADYPNLHSLGISQHVLRSTAEQVPLYGPDDFRRVWIVHRGILVLQMLASLSANRNDYLYSVEQLMRESKITGNKHSPWPWLKVTTDLLYGVPDPEERDHIRDVLNYLIAQTIN